MECAKVRSGPLGSEGGFALIGALMVMVLVTALGSAAVFLSRLDLMLAGNYRVQRTAEAAADGALDLGKAMIYGNSQLLNLPLSVPTNGTASTWSRSTTYSDPNIDVTVMIKYKQEDNINFNAVETYTTDEVVRYGRDYNYEKAQKAIGRQPVYTMTVSDNRTGVKAEADLISTIGFRTPAALFCGGRVHMQKYAWATEESVEVTAGTGTPAVATASTNTGDITIETVRESSTFSGTTTLTAAAAAGAGTITVASTTGFPNGSGAVPGRFCLGASNVTVTYTGKDATHFTGCVGVPAAAAGTFVNIASGNRTYNAVNPTASNQYAVNPSYLHRRVYRPSEVQASKVAGLYHQAVESAHILLGIGDRLAKEALDAAYTAAGGGSAGATAADALFRFYNRSADSTATVYDVPVAFNNTVSPPQCSGIVCYGYQMPAAQSPLTQLETMFGQSFADLKALADQKYTCTSTVTLPTGGSSNYGCDLSNVSLGSSTAPEVVYFNGTGNANPIALVTQAGKQVKGFGILVIDGDADIIGSIDWRGLMLIRGNLMLRPWQGGTQAVRSNSTLKTTWNGFIIIGGNLDLWTYWGGSIILGYSSSEVAAIKGIISSALPHKVLSWRRTYN